MIVVDRNVFKIIFVSNYYDVPLSGTCEFEGKRYKFKKRWIDPDDDYEEKYELIPLDKIQSIKQNISQWLFEVFVGSHWTYKDGIRDYSANLKPKWKMNFYYKVIRKIIKW